MKRSVLKPIIAGILLGTAAFFMPFFLLKAVFFIFIIGSIIRMVMWRRYYGGRHYYLAYTDKIRGMSEEEYNAFKNKMNNWSHCGERKRTWKSYNCDYRDEHNACEEKEPKNNETKKD